MRKKIKNGFAILFFPIFLLFFFFPQVFFYEKKVEIEKEEFKIEKKPIKEDPLLKIYYNLISLEKVLNKLKERIEKERIKKIRERSEKIIGVYLTSHSTLSFSIYSRKIREKIFKLIEEEKINGLVIDVKEAEGPKLKENLKDFLKELEKRNVWKIARIVLFRDNSLLKTRPHWYLQDKSGNIFKDRKGFFWLDPSKEEVKKYLISFSKKTIDFGFDELQFDYIRFPSEGDLEKLVWSKEEREEIIGNFAQRLIKELKSYKKEIVLSVDLFGYLATLYRSREIGQNLAHFKDFDFISFMLYPSHFYGGFKTDELFFPYESEDISQVVSNHPYEVIYYSLISARDFLEKINSKAKLRPWLQAFDLKKDLERGIVYEKEMIFKQIKACQDASSSGYLFWNPENIYQFLE